MIVSAGVAPAFFCLGWASTQLIFIEGTLNLQNVLNRDDCPIHQHDGALNVIHLFDFSRSSDISSANIFFWTAVLCAFHFIVNAKTPVFSKVPMMFGGISSTFMLGGDKWWVIMITLCCGVLLAFLCQCGTLLLDESGHWKLPGKTNES